MAITQTLTIPAQRRATSSREQGLVGGVAPVHALRPTLHGATAMCGAGTVSLRVPGRFDPASLPACPACSGLTS